MKDAPHYPINANVFYGDLYKMWVSFKLIMELMENMIFSIQLKLYSETGKPKTLNTIKENTQ